jgi:phosphatidylinositol 4-phosphatase
VVDDVKFTLLFVSRRSRYRQGCRFTKRGINEHGHVANFVETEQILVFSDGRVSSYVEIRGSIPVKWSSPVHMRYAPEVFIDEDKAQSADWAERHIRECIELYSDNAGNSNILCINLVDNKKEQGRLGTAFKETMDLVRPRVAPTPLSYVWFDFHHETAQKGKWNNLAKLVTLVDETFRAQKFFSKNAAGQVTSWQIGCIRTNCMDNLDRTNVVQSLFARRSLVLQVGKEGLVDMDGKGLLETPWKPFELMFKHVWVNNANAISLAYAGTGALKVDFTRTGKRSFEGMFNDGVNSCMRYYFNNLTDGVKQDSIDLLVGNYRPDANAPSPFASTTKRDSLASNATKVFVVFTMMFSSMLLFIPAARVPADSVDSLLAVETNISKMRTSFLVSLLFSLSVAGYFSFKIVKKGSVLGASMVVHPVLCPEPLPAGR